MSKDKKEKNGPDRADKYRRIGKMGKIEQVGLNRSIWEVSMDLLSDEEINSLIKELDPGQEKKAIDPTRIIPGTKEKKKTGLFRISASMTNQLTKHGGKKENLVSNIFHDLEPIDQSKVLDLGIEIIGMALGRAEQKLNRTFYRLLRDKSEDYNTYLGNYPTQTSGGLISPGLRLSPSELYKSYSNKSNPSGREMELTRKAVASFCRNEHIFIWKEKYEINGETKYRVVRQVRPACRATYIYDLDTEDEVRKAITGDPDTWSAKGEIILEFHPLFAYQIDSKYSALPDDIEDRLAIAAGGVNRVSSAHDNLLNFFNQHLSVPTNGLKLEVNTSNLYHILGLEKEIKAKRKKRLNEITEKTIKACKELGILDKYEVKKGSKGQEKYVFTLRKEWF